MSSAMSVEICVLDGLSFAAIIFLFILIPLISTDSLLLTFLFRDHPSRPVFMCKSYFPYITCSPWTVLICLRR